MLTVMDPVFIRVRLSEHLGQGNGEIWTCFLFGIRLRESNEEHCSFFSSLKTATQALRMATFSIYSFLMVIWRVYPLDCCGMNEKPAYLRSKLI